MKYITLTVLLSCFVVITACSQRQMLMFDKNPLVANEQTIAQGKILFLEHCQQCHGTSGKGDEPLAKTLPEKPADLTDLPLFPQGFIEFAITTGGDTEYMPEWRKILTKEQIQQVGIYLHTIQR